MSGIEIGQVLSLKMRFNNSGLISTRKHPYLVVGNNEELNTLEVAQIDSLKGKEYKAAMKSNKVIYCDEPKESVIDKDSYIQLDNTFLLENYNGLERYRRQDDKLSEDKLKDAIKAYRKYHEKHQIAEDKQVYITKRELEKLQST